MRTGGADTDFVVIRLTAAGLRDATFGDNGLFSLDITAAGDGGVYSNNASPRSVTILPGTDGIIGGGYQPIPGADTSPVLFKVKDNGTLDTTFGDQGVYKELVLAEQAETYEAVVQPNASGSGYKLVTTGYGRELSNQTADIFAADQRRRHPRHHRLRHERDGTARRRRLRRQLAPAAGARRPPGPADGRRAGHVVQRRRPGRDP